VSLLYRFRSLANLAHWLLLVGPFLVSGCSRAKLEEGVDRPHWAGTSRRPAQPMPQLFPETDRPVSWWTEVDNRERAPRPQDRALNLSPKVATREQRARDARIDLASAGALPGIPSVSDARNLAAKSADESEAKSVARQLMQSLDAQKDTRRDEETSSDEDEGRKPIVVSLYYPRRNNAEGVRTPEPFPPTEGEPTRAKVTFQPDVPELPKQPAKAPTTPWPTPPGRTPRKQNDKPPGATEGTSPATDSPREDPAVEQADCKSCGNGLLGQPRHERMPPRDWSCGSNCVPGRECVPGHDVPDTCLGRFFAGIYDCVCCPDPCYEPRWVGAATASFFADSARPITETRLRGDWGLNLRYPDRSEYFMARENVTTALAAGGPCPRPNTPKGISAAERSVDYRDFRFYQEIGSGNFSAFVDTPYRRVNFELAPCDASGFADMEVGTKSLFLDCELLQLSFQLKTTIPVGLVGKGLGTGHVSIEPSLLWSLHLAPDTYFQGQTAYSIPIAGDQVYAGDLFHYHLSFNHVLCRPYADLEVVGTLEMNGWAFLDGAYTNPDERAADPANPLVLVPTTQSSRGHLFSLGGGVRLIICDKVDVGVGSAFATTHDHLAQQQYRLEVRWRY
jgi:hypothetical protein